MTHTTDPSWLDRLQSLPDAQPLELGDISVIQQARQVLPEAAVQWGAAVALEVAQEVEAELDQEMAGSHAGDTGLEGPACVASVLTTLMCLRTGNTSPPAPQEALRQVRAAFHQGAELSAVLRFVWAHHAKVQQRLLLVQRDLAPQEQDGAGLQELHTRMNRILDVYVSAMVAAFEHERLNWEGGSPARRRQLIEALVAGEEIPPNAEERLGMRLRGHHLVAFAGSRDGALEEEHIGWLRTLGPTVSPIVGASGGFTQDFGSGILLCWTFASAPSQEIVARIGSMDLPGWLLLCFGPLGEGPEGLRRSLQGALETRDTAEHPARGRPATARAEVLSYGQMGLVGILLQDQARLVRFVDATLGALAGTSPRVRDVRTTVFTYLLTGHSRKLTAQTLHIAPNTVAYRVQKAEQLLGRDLGQDLLGMLLALQVLETLPALMDRVGQGSGHRGQPMPTSARSRPITT